jgi:hypothetical protein
MTSLPPLKKIIKPNSKENKACLLELLDHTVEGIKTLRNVGQNVSVHTAGTINTPNPQQHRCENLQPPWPSNFLPIHISRVSRTLSLHVPDASLSARYIHTYTTNNPNHAHLTALILTKIHFGSLQNTRTLPSSPAGTQNQVTKLSVHSCPISETELLVAGSQASPLCPSGKSSM